MGIVFKKTKIVLRNVLFIALPSILVFLLLFEGVLRIGGFLYARYRHPKNYAAAALGKQVPGSILCLGDSFTVGMGAAAEYSYPRQLEALLRKSDYPGARVINGGKPGDTSSLLLRGLQSDIDQYRPKIIIVMIGMNNYWNLNGSSYFLLHKDRLSFRERLDDLLGGSRVYKLLKMGWLNLRVKVKRKERATSDGRHQLTDVTEILRELAQGEDDAAYEKLREIVSREKDNYRAHLALAYILSSRGDFDQAREELWSAINFTKAWDNDFLERIIVIVEKLCPSSVDREKELVILKEYIRVNIPEPQRRALSRVLDARIDFLRHAAVSGEVLEYDLTQIKRISERNHVVFILQTYLAPGWQNVFIRDICLGQQITLVENEFGKIGKGGLSGLFVPDGHCTALGYGIIAENVFRTLVEHGFLTSA